MQTWKVEAYLATSTRNNGKPDQTSGCAVILRGTLSEKGEAVAQASREIVQTLGNKNQAQADLYSATAALAAVQPKAAETTLRTNSRYVVSVLTKKDGQWGAVDKNQGLVQKLREAYDSFGSCAVEFDNASDHVKRAGKLAKASLADQADSDSGTLIEAAA